MIATLRDHLGENIRLHNVLDNIKAEIARLKKLLNTPKPKFKFVLVIVAIVVAIGGMMLGSDRSKALFYGALLAGVGLIALAIVLKVRGVVDVEFESGKLPMIKDALEVNMDGKRLVMEVSSHIGNNVVRCILLASSEGLAKGMEVVATGS